MNLVVAAYRIRVPALAVALAALLLAPLAGFGVAAQRAAEEETEPNGRIVYHQITNLTEGTGSVGWPILSADGTTAVFADSPGSGDAAIPNRIFVVDADGGEPTEVDAYQTLCYCGSRVDISGDGETVVSTEGLQLRIADDGGARELLSAAEITAVRITADGETVFFLVRRDTATIDGTPLPRGVWAIGADGDDLRQVVGAEDVAEAVGVPIAETGCCFHADGQPLDISADGGRVVFAAYAGTGEHLFAVDGDGGEPNVLIGPVSWVKNVAISADGETIGYNVVPPDKGGDDEAGVVPFGGGEPRLLATTTQAGFGEPMQLNEDGSVMLLSPLGLLIDTASGETRQLAVLTPGANSQTSLLTDTLARATMDEEGERVLYVIRGTRCADCPNMPEQLARLDLDPAELGAAPVIAEATIAPDEIPLDYAAAATASAAVDADGELVAVGLVTLRDGRHDINVGYGVSMLDDGENADARANDGVFTNAAIVHAAVVARDDDTGPRVVRVQAEVEDDAGFRHATAVDVGTLTVVAGR